MPRYPIVILLSLPQHWHDWATSGSCPLQFVSCGHVASAVGVYPAFLVPRKKGSNQMYSTANYSLHNVVDLHPFVMNDFPFHFILIILRQLLGFLPETPHRAHVCLCACVHVHVSVCLPVWSWRASQVQACLRAEEQVIPGTCYQPQKKAHRSMKLVLKNLFFRLRLAWRQ